MYIKKGKYFTFSFTSPHLLWFQHIYMDKKKAYEVKKKKKCHVLNDSSVI